MTAPSRRNWYLLGAIAILAIGLRFSDFGRVPLWTDELFTRFYPQLGLSYLWGDGFRSEPTPPLYYSIIWAVEHLLGSSAFALRLPSALASLASVGLAWTLGRELFGRSGPALLGALLVSLAPTNVFYAGEARGYALQGAALALALLGLARVLRGTSGLLAYGIGAGAALWLHPTSVCAVAAMNVVAIVAIGFDPALGWRDWWRWLLVNALLAAICLPLLPGLLAPPEGGAATNWIPALTRPSFEGVIGEVLAGPALIRQAQAIAELSVVGLVGLVLLPPWRLPWRSEWRALAVLVLVPGGTLLLMVGISLFKPILLGRTLAWMLVPLAVALGGILFRRPVLAAGVVALTSAALLIQISRGAALKEDWPGLFAQMTRDGPAALVVLAPHSPPAATEVYGRNLNRVVRLDDGGPPVPETAIIPRLFGTATFTKAELQEEITAGRPVWLVYRRPEYGWVQQQIAGLPAPARTVQSEGGSNPALRALGW